VNPQEVLEPDWVVIAMRRHVEIARGLPYRLPFGHLVRDTEAGRLKIARALVRLESGHSS
jgi:hypothetical protein